MLELECVPNGSLPLCSTDLEGTSGVAAWSALRAAIQPADVVLFVTPEYNRSMPAALKSELDVGLGRWHGQG
jgi:chromate reductase